MKKALLDQGGVCQNIIEVAIPAAYPLQPGWTLADPTGYSPPTPTAFDPPIPQPVQAVLDAKQPLGNYDPSAHYRTLLNSTGSHTAVRVAGTYGMGQGDPLAISGTGMLYPLNLIYLDPNDFPSQGGLAGKLRIRCNLHCNDVAPASNFTIGLHPVTRPATSGGAGLCIYTLGAAVAGSTVVSSSPAADASVNLVGSDFALPAAGFYVIGVVTSAPVATSAHVHLGANLQLRYA